MFNIGDNVFYPFDGFGVGVVESVKQSEIQNEGYVYHIQFNSGNSANLFENPRLVAFDPENKEHMGNAVPKSTKPLMSKKAAAVVKEGAAVKPTKAPKVEKAAKEPRAEKAPKVEAPAGLISLSQARKTYDMSKFDMKFVHELRGGKVASAVKVGIQWYFDPKEVESRLSN